MNLLELHDEAIITKTSLSRKLTLGGVTKAYPVYRVRLDQLFYNDQNDRIATWITQYKNGADAVDLSTLSREEYNGIIERFIIESNPAAIEKTKNNIALVNQREPGVVLADGRVIDGNRRFTCLRLLQAAEGTPRYLETVILDASAEADRKQIKLLELAIQHGEEQRVDYNLIDMAIGAYHDIVETKLLTLDEYVESTAIPHAEVKRKLETAKLIIDFLAFMGVAGQYHIAREMQVYSVFLELTPLLKRCESEEAAAALTQSVFSNTMMCAFADQRKYIRNVRAMMDSGTFSAYIKKQLQLVAELEEKKREHPIHNEQELKSFIKANEDIAEDLQIAMDRAMTQSKKQETKARPSQLVSKSLSMIMDIDTRILDVLSDGEREKLGTQLHKLSDAITLIRDEVEEVGAIPNDSKKAPDGSFLLAPQPAGDPIVYCADVKPITTLNFSLHIAAVATGTNTNATADRLLYFINEAGEELCPRQEICVTVHEEKRVSFSLAASASSLERCYLVIQSPKHTPREAYQLLEIPLKIAFAVDFDF